MTAGQINWPAFYFVKRRKNEEGYIYFYFNLSWV